MKLILTGATGVAGLSIYRAALADPAVTKVTLLLRRELPSWAVLPANAQEKTETIIHTDYASYPSELATRLAQHDACIWALGKASKGISEPDYTRLTYDYPMAFINAVKEVGAGTTRSKGEEFRMVYISGEMADPEQKSWQMWARVKGRAEKDLTTFAQTNTGFATHIIRPGYFFPSKEYPADRLNQRGSGADCVDRIMSPVYSTLLPSLYTPIDTLGKIAVELAKGRFKDITLVRNSTLRELGSQL
ncbi:hypothetical protein QCA50_013349 [Cerrena zonata]|uniref:NAD(P)-binding domain-containing protein n=1 Tax=Cerrena zonata TaxID=2478898 RepID=A0AAW0G384_9APHY